MRQSGGLLLCRGTCYRYCQETIVITRRTTGNDAQGESFQENVCPECIRTSLHPVDSGAKFRSGHHMMLDKSKNSRPD